MQCIIKIFPRRSRTVGFKSGQKGMRIFKGLAASSFVSFLKGLITMRHHSSEYVVTRDVWWIVYS